MKRIFILITIAIFSLTACTGSFKLVKTVNKLHRSQSEKWVDEVIFLGCIILPVYGLASLGDAIILNTVEFWTGKNPMNASLESSKTIKDGHKTAVISYGEDSDTLNIASNIAPNTPMKIQKTDNGVLLKDNSGKVLFTSTKDENGGVSVFDNDMKLVKYFSPEEVANKQLL